MQKYIGDIHIHSLLSPCGSLDMSPIRIIEVAKLKKLDFIGITDHNTTLQAMLICEMGLEHGVKVFPGVEINTKEEVHCLAFFETAHQLQQMQDYIDQHLPSMFNNPDYFGEQVVVDRKENIVYNEERFLHAALHVGIKEISLKVQELGGLFIPAHINRKGNGIISQLGFIPNDLYFDALEIYRLSDPEMLRVELKIPSNVSVIKNSDAHYPDEIGRQYSEYRMPDLSFESLKKAFKQQEDCSVTPHL